MNDEHARRTVRVDLDELRFAMEDASYEHHYFVDIESGEVILICDWSDDETPEDLTKIDEPEPGRYLQVPRAESREGYEDMQAFIDTISDERLRELLDVAIQAAAHFVASRMCWHAIPPSKSGGSPFRRRGWMCAPASGWPKKV